MRRIARRVVRSAREEEVKAAAHEPQRPSLSHGRERSGERGSMSETPNTCEITCDTHTTGGDWWSRLVAEVREAARRPQHPFILSILYP